MATKQYVNLNGITAYDEEIKQYIENEISSIEEVEELNDLKDVSVSNPKTGQILVYEASSGQFVNRDNPGSTGAVKVADVSGLSSSISGRTASFTWTDPDDVVLSGVTLAEWAGTLVVRKAGSAPSDQNDGTIVIDSTTRNAYASTALKDSNLEFGTTYYYRFFPYTTQGSYTTGSSVSVTPVKIVVTPPTVTADLTYNGTKREATVGTYDSSIVSVTGITGTNAGNYTAVVSLIDPISYEWSTGGSSNIKTIWTIKKAKVTVPTITGSFTYDTTQKTASVSTYDNTIIQVTGITGTNAATYTATMHLKDANHMWTDETTADKTATWTIAQATGGCTLTPSTVVIDPDHSSATSTISNATGTVTGVSCADATITTSLSGNTITVSYSGSDSKTVNVSVNIAASQNYTAKTVTLTVSCEFLKIVTFADGTDAEIAAMLDAYYNDQITWQDMGWAVGNTRKIHLNSMSAPNPNSSNTWAAQDITLVIVDHEHTDLATAINGHTKACITVQTREVLNNNTSGYNQAGHIYVNGDSAYDTTFTKWSNLYMRTYLNDKVLGAIPSGAFKSAIKPSKHYRHTTYNGSVSEEVTDTLFLPSYPEIFGTASYNYYVTTNPTEGTQFKYYQTASNRIKYGNNNGASNGTAQYWWQGSASSRYNSSIGYYWCDVDSGGTAGNSCGNRALGLAPAFAM